MGEFLLASWHSTARLQLGGCCLSSKQVFEPSILIDPAELRSEASVERLEKANKYLKDMAYKKVRELRTPVSSFRKAISRPVRRKNAPLARHKALRKDVLVEAVRMQQIDCQYFRRFFPV